MTTTTANLLQRCLLRNFSDAEIEQHGLLERPIDSNFRKEMAEIDWEFFCLYYLPQHFTKPFADMHYELADDFTRLLGRNEPSHEVVAFPRGFGKTTWVSLALPLYCILFEKRKYIILLAQGHDQSKDYLADIKRELEENERIREDFGDLVGKPWQMTEIRTSTGIRIKPLGARMKLRGRKEGHQRPDCVIADDLEDIVSASNEAERKARKLWVMRTVLKAGTDNTVFFFVGNLIHNDGVIAMLLNNPLFIKREYKAVVSWATRTDLWESWKRVLSSYPLDPDRAKSECRTFYQQHKREMDDGAVSSWPEGQSYYDLMIELAVGGRTAFFAEMQNEPLSPEDRVFEYGKYRSAVDADGRPVLVPLTGHPAVHLDQCAFFGAVDPSLGKRTSDPSAIVVLAKAPTGQLFVVVDDERVRPPYTIIRDMQRHNARFPTTRFAIEVVQFQALFATDAARESMKEGSYINYVQVPAKTNKFLRISSLEPALAMQYVLLPEFGAEQLCSQLENWPNVANDDGLDALELVYRTASKFDMGMLFTAVEGEMMIAGDGALFAPQTDPYFLEAEKAAHQRETIEAIKAEKEPPKELWLPMMRY